MPIDQDSELIDLFKAEGNFIYEGDSRYIRAFISRNTSTGNLYLIISYDEGLPGISRRDIEDLFVTEYLKVENDENGEFYPGNLKFKYNLEDEDACKAHMETVINQISTAGNGQERLYGPGNRRIYYYTTIDGQISLCY